MSCTPERREFTYKITDLQEFLRVDSLYYSRGFSDEEKVHKNLIYTIEDRMWFDRAVHPAIREVMTYIRRHSPFEDGSGVRDVDVRAANRTTALEDSAHKVLYFAIRDELVKKEYYEALRGAIFDFLRAYFICEWLKDKNTPAYGIAIADYEKKKAALLTAATNLKKCNQLKRRRGWW